MILPGEDGLDGVEQFLNAERLFQMCGALQGFRHGRFGIPGRIDEWHVAPAERFSQFKAALSTQVDVEHGAVEAFTLGQRQGLRQAWDRADDLGSARFQGVTEIVGNVMTRLRPGERGSR